MYAGIHPGPAGCLPAASRNVIDRYWRVWYHFTRSTGAPVGMYSLSLPWGERTECTLCISTANTEWEPMTLVASGCRPDIAATLERAAAGARLSAQETYAFEHTTSSELLALVQVADALRAQHHGGVITYSRKVFLPLTNLCRDYCGYCTFRKDPGDPGAKTMTPDEVLAVATAGARLGCKEALFSLGDKPEALFPEMRQTLQYYGHRRTLDYLVQMCRLVLDQTPLLPHANPGVMGPRDLERLREVSPSMGIMLETTSRRLLGKGMAHDNAPDKDPAVRLKTIENAGKLKIPFTTGILIGIGETFH